MSTKIQLTTKLDQRLTINPQLRQAISLLQYTTLDLKQLVQQTLETNPFLEAQDTEIKESTSEEDYSIYVGKHGQRTRFNQNNDDKNYIENYSPPLSLRDHLLEQTLVCQFDKNQQLVAESIIDAIDENGTLTMTLSEIQQTLSKQVNIPIEIFNHTLEIIQTFDPAGVGHRNLRECLLIQLHLNTNKNVIHQNALLIVQHHFDKLGENNCKKLALLLKISQQDLADAIGLIRSLNPKPGLRYSSDIDIEIEPDLYVKKVKGKWQVFLSENILTSLKIHSQYQDLIKQYKKHESYEVLNKELQEAQWLMKGLKRRNETLLNVASFIIERQSNFLEYGHAFMKPMNIVDVSQALNLHESTVSRVTTEKYIATPRGMFELKYFFPSYVLTDSGNTCSATTVKEFIKDILTQENNTHIFSDNEIAALLKEKKGINIARRTVAKYREAMKILPSYQRVKRSSD